LAIILNILIFIGNTIYTMFPAIAANMAPAITRKISIMNYPLDFNKILFGKPILGSNKTFRGLISGILFSIIIINIQYILFKYAGFNFTLYDFDLINYQLLGFLLGFGVIAGDAIKSFFKRRFDILPGKSFIPWDQIDSSLGALLFGKIAWDYSWVAGITIVILTFIIHVIIRHIGYYLGIVENKW
jgi:CDP-2,3-bis-(O-geranylgeranyl)-sn-glycerol synthase